MANLSQDDSSPEKYFMVKARSALAMSPTEYVPENTVPVRLRRTSVVILSTPESARDAGRHVASTSPTTVPYLNLDSPLRMDVSPEACASPQFMNVRRMQDYSHFLPQEESPLRARMNSFTEENNKIKKQMELRERLLPLSKKRCQSTVTRPDPKALDLNDSGSASGMECSPDDDAKRAKRTFSRRNSSEPFKFKQVKEENVLISLVCVDECPISTALSHADRNPNSIGDLTALHVLPLLEKPRNPGVRTIHADTLASLMRGEFDDKVSHYVVIDCRYRYEYYGGHIRGAINIDPKDHGLLQRTLFSNVFPTARDQLTDPRRLFAIDENADPSVTTAFTPFQTDSTDGRRKILIFHCEFSAARGPNA